MAGHKIIHVPEMIVGHPTRATLGELIRKRRRVIGGRWRMDGMSEAGVPKTLWRMVHEAKGQARWMVRTKIGTRNKFGVLGITAALMLASQAEVLRLSVGRPPYRS